MWPWPRPLFADFIRGSCREFGSRRLCQISSKSVKNWDRERASTHTRKCVGQWTSDIGHGKWFYILSNAAIHSIGQTIKHEFLLISSCCCSYFPLFVGETHLKKAQCSLVSKQTGVTFDRIVPRTNSHRLTESVFCIDVILTRLRPRRIRSGVRRLPADPPSARDVIGSLYALQFVMIHRASVLVGLIKTAHARWMFEVPSAIVCVTLNWWRHRQG